MNHVLDQLARAVTVAIAVLAIGFIVLYAQRPWRSRIGWTLMVSEISIAVVFIAQLVVWLVGPFPGVHAVQLAVFALILLGQGSLLWAVLATRPPQLRRHRLSTWLSLGKSSLNARSSRAWDRIRTRIQHLL